jgi:2-polyprenyl-3-methyl-5-hydroxy-6-metoxy-1,4-benzoquinol methylase
MSQTLTCVLCGNADASRFTFLTDKFRYEVKKTAHRCEVCGLVFIVPLMSAEEERIFYEKEYGVIYSQEKGATPKDLFEKRMPDARMYLAWVEKYLRKTDDCLEIGCASGYFLHTIKDRVKSVTGYETHVELNKYCGEIGIPTLPNLAAAGAARFDKIFIFFVLEHVGDPFGFLAAMKKMLKPGGELFIVVPNVDDILLSTYPLPAFRDFYFTPAHQYYYSKATLAKLLGKAGFSAADVMPEQRYDLSNHIHWAATGKPGGQSKYNAAFSAKTLSSYAEDLKAKFLCDTLFAVARN